MPLPATQQVDGVSLVALLRGDTDAALAGRDLFWHYPHYGNQGGDPTAIIRRGDWKLIHYFEDGHDELYDLAADPGEEDDRTPARPQEAAVLRQRLAEWLAEVGAKLPEPDPQYDARAEGQRLHQLEHEFMPQLECQHAEYLQADWQPNDNWWGSQVTVD